MKKYLMFMGLIAATLWLIGYICVCFFHWEILNPVQILIDLPSMSPSDRGFVMLVIFLYMFFATPFAAMFADDVFSGSSKSSSYYVPLPPTVREPQKCPPSCNDNDALDTVAKVGVGAIIGSLFL